MNDKRKLDPIILREYDIRGVVGENLNAGEVRINRPRFWFPS